MREIRPEDLDNISRGAAILGTGGGGDPYIGRLTAEAALRQFGPVRLMDLDEIGDDALAVAVAMVGSPTVFLEKPPTLQQIASAPRLLASHLGRELTHLICAEVGGVNSLIPMAAAAVLGLPLVNADGMGRAFPKIGMSIPAMNGIRANPLALADEKGNHSIVLPISNAWAERITRSTAVDLGCAIIVSTSAMSGQQAREFMVPATLSLCSELGSALEQARAGKSDPVAAVVEKLGGTRLFTGKVIDVSRRTESGFTLGEVRLAALDTGLGSEMVLRFQNEYLVAELDDAVAATTPDLICTLDTATGNAITVERLRFGQRLSVISAPADPRWHSADAISLVGPRSFGYDIDPVRA
ncbi:DUF917 domain-containing protein [Amycolatopsis jejuensis]|uniref:DUF917 domain-containing protein n=1 Tax=Amycolatopsis jejuensis TaxID=330084 RepID=UPI0005255D69|nr:DUF917 domain-containing protein [Amycolatopsis jejuensis]